MNRLMNKYNYVKKLKYCYLLEHDAYLLSLTNNIY